LKPNCQMDCITSFQVSSEVHSWLHSTVHFQSASLMLSRCSQVNSKYARKFPSEYVLMYTPGHGLQDTPNHTRWHTPSLLDCTLPCKLSRLSQSHFSACAQVHSQLHSMGLPACFTTLSQVSSQDALNYTPEHTVVKLQS